MNAVKYFIRYFDVKGIEHVFNIYHKEIIVEGEIEPYIEPPIQIDGSVTLTFADSDSALDAIRGQGLSVQLEANQDLTFNDLWSEDEKTYKVDYRRDGEILFIGWLNPEGWFENWVNTNWIITFDCVDGLGYLSDLSFVDDYGFPVTGKKSYIEILSIALRRTGLKKRINTSINIIYNGLDNDKDILYNVYANTNRYIKDDGDTIMSCEDVINDILEPFCACLVSYKGEWYIYKPNYIYNNSELSFFRYEYDGVPVNTYYYEPKKTLNLSFTLGSNINEFYPHHCSGNQTIRNKASIGAYRINYKYGDVQPFFNNYNLISLDGYIINDFNIISTDNLHLPFPIATGGVTIDCVPSFPGKEQIRSVAGMLYGDDSAQITIRFSDTVRILRQFQYQIRLTDKPIGSSGITTYYLQDDFTWGTSSNVINTAKIDYGGGVSLVTKTPPKPSAITGDGYVYVSIWTPVRSSGSVTVNEVSMIKVLSDTLEGEFHTLQRTTNPSAKVEDVKVVATGDNLANVYLGTLYKSDKITPTETWNRLGVDEEKPLLQIMGEETLRLNQKTSRVFSGDIYGYFQYFSVIYIDGLDGVFLPIKYSYDTKNNIINADFKQIYGDELEDIDYEKTFDYGETVKPTIRG